MSRPATTGRPAPGPTRRSTPGQARRSPRQPARRPASRQARRSGPAPAAGRRDTGEPGAGRADPGRARFRRRRLLALLALAALLGTGLVLGARFLLVESGLFGVRDVVVTGASSVPTEAVLAAAAVEPGTPLIVLDTAAVAGRIAAVPGVGSAEVSRSWPSTLVVRIAERSAVAITAGTAERRLVDAAGNAYAPVPAQSAQSAPPALPELEVATPAPDDPSTLAALRVLAALPEPVRRELVAVGASSPDAVTLRLAGERTVHWGSADGSERKAAVLVALLTRPGSVYDVASPDLPTVRR